MTVRVLVLLAPGFEEIEVTCPVNLLRRAEAEVLLASTGDDLLGHRALTDSPAVADCFAVRIDRSMTPLTCSSSPGDPPSLPYGKNPAFSISFAAFILTTSPWGPSVPPLYFCLDAGILEEGRHCPHRTRIHPGGIAQRLDRKSGHPIVSGHIITSRGAGTARILRPSLGGAVIWARESARKSAAAIHAA